MHAGLWFLFSSSLISWTSSYLGQTRCPSENLGFYFTKRMRGVIYERPDPVLFFLFCFSFDEWEALGKDFFPLSSYFFYHSLLISMWYWPLHLKCFCPVVWSVQSRWVVWTVWLGRGESAFVPCHRTSLFLLSPSWDLVIWRWEEGSQHFEDYQKVTGLGGW